jgi:hypothetical protein
VKRLYWKVKVCLHQKTKEWLFSLYRLLQYESFIKIKTASKRI